MSNTDPVGSIFLWFSCFLIVLMSPIYSDSLSSDESSLSDSSDES